MDEPVAPIFITGDHPALRLDEDLLERLIRHVLREEQRTPQYVGVILTGHETVSHLNQEFLGRDYQTDVLSFDLREEDDPPHVVEGEVFVDLDTAKERAPEFNTTFELEAFRYVVHGLLHLLGYDDADPEEKRIMHELEDKYLRDFGA